MFEGSLVESRGLVSSGTRKWTAVGSLTVQCLAVGLVLTLPLLRPQVLRAPMVAPPLMAPLFRKPVEEVKPALAASAARAVSLPAAEAAAASTDVRTIWPHGDGLAEKSVPVVDLGPGMGQTAGHGTVLRIGEAASPKVAVSGEETAAAVRLSTGVSNGLLLAPIRPVYPAIAKAAGVQGTVVVEAVISKEGRIESLHAVSGPMMLARAAMDAVASARYRPYFLNGEATEVKTTITVVFQLGG